MGNAYTYYSFEEYGRGYIGARSKSPIGDDAYMGTYSDKDFNPTQKIILAEYETMEEAIEAEVLLHAFYEVDTNPHFANVAKQTTSKFYYDSTGRVKSEEECQKLKDSWTDERRIAQAERMSDYNKSQEHRQSVIARNKIHKPWGNKSRTGMKNSAEMNKKISQKSRGVKKSKEMKDKLRGKATGRKLITNGERNTWLYPGQEMPEGWRFTKKA